MRRTFLLLGGVLMGCPASPPDNICGYDICDGGTSDGPGVDAPANCDLSKDPKDSPACVDSSVGVFVDATNGKDSNPGTKTAPMQTIGAALGKTGTLKRLYVCEGTYAEDLLLDASHDGVSIYGGWKCADWSYSGNKPVVGKTPNASKLDSLTKPVVVEDLEIDAADGTTTASSSVAMFVNGSANVTLSRLKLSAGKGAAGKSSTQQAQAAKATDGTSSTSNSGGAQCTNTCADGNSIGGKGGDVGSANAQDGQPSYGGTYPNNGGHGTDSTNCLSGGAGGTGVAGTAGQDKPGSSSIGTLSASGWLPGGGNAGTSGTRGQGGGGGGARAGGGGGGACGGCGGAGGTPGDGGGASIALALNASTVSITSSTLIATTGGAGGTGAAGQLGQAPGGGGGGGPGSPAGCGGGDGATGGNGGAGGGGAGGISVGVLWKGTAAPTLDSASQTAISVAASGGAKGLGGNVGVNDGIDGVAKPVLQSP